jgi:hypothetical protein
MDNTFTSSKPEEDILVRITKREAVLVGKLRKYPFGKFIIHKVNGLVIRLEVNDSQLVEPDSPIDL